MIIKIIILRLLGSSDDKEKEKIGVARPEGPPLRGLADGGRGGAAPRGSQGSALKALHSVAPEEPTHEAPVHPMVVGRTDAMVEGYRSQVSLWAPDEPTGQKGASVHWASYVPETMSRAQEKFLQHRLNR